MRIIREWGLIIAMVAGVCSYFAYVRIPFLRGTYAFANQMVDFLQPALIFCMLFLTFCKVNPSKLRLCKWHLVCLALQGLVFTVIGMVLVFMPHSGMRIVLEGAMICMICPTATAAAVITRKLGGNLNQVTTYTVLINLLVALLVPALLPYVHPHEGLTTWNASMLILGKVFPLLLLPLILALLMRYLFPHVNHKITRAKDAPFYLWLVSLSLAVAVTTRSIVHTHVAVTTQLWLVAVSLICCMGQFWLGRKIGAKYGQQITGGQALGQKNTVFAIWLGYTFFTPITSIVGGFYSIWHNLVNSYQLYKHHKAEQSYDASRDAHNDDKL